MSDITINYKGSAIATMDASSTKTLLTEGKYCEDDIDVVYVKPSSGGSSVLSGTFTPASDTDVVTIPALAGMTQDHLWIKPSGIMTNGLVSNKRTVVYSWIDFSSGNKNAAFAASNTSGTNYNYYTAYAASGFNSQGDLDSTRYSFVRSTGVLTCKIPTSNNGGKWAAGVTYDWYAW